MEEGKKRIMVISLAVVVIIVVASLGFVFIRRASVISMEEGKPDADIAIASINSDYFFLGAHGNGDNYNGLFNSWSYNYYNYSGINYTEIEVFSNREIIFDYHKMDNETITRISEFIVNQWSFDSPDALDIANSNDKIKTFLRKYNTKIDLFQLNHPVMELSSITIDMPVWYISYSRMTYLDDPKSAEIYIDATTGEVLYVKANN